LIIEIYIIEFINDEVSPMAAYKNRIPTLDLDLLRTFVTICETRHFTRAADLLLRNQSTISLQLKRLEDLVGRRLFDRSPHNVKLSDEGRELLDYAQQMLRMNDEFMARLSEPELKGLVRLGTPEDFATSHLPEVLSRFSKSHPKVRLEVKCDLTLNLLEQFRARKFDLVLLKREPKAARSLGIRVWEEPLVWVSSESYAGSPQRSEALSLALSPEPCVYRKRAVDSLDRIRRPWRIAYSCESLAGTLAAVRAGLGVTVLPRGMIPPGLSIVTRKYGLPDLPHTEIALMEAARLSRSAQQLRNHIVESLETA